MKRRMSVLAMVFGVLVAPGLAAAARAGTIYEITYQDLAIETTTDLTTAGTLDWVKWGNGGTSGSPAYTTPEKAGGSIINPALTPLGTVPQGQSVLLIEFNPPPTVLDFTWTDGTEPMAGGGPVASLVSETITPAQFSYPLGLGLSFTASADASPRLLNVYVQGFNTRMGLTASLSGGGSASLIASNAALVPLAGGNNNDFSAGIFSILYTGAGETLTVNLTAANQSGVPTNVPQYGFRNAGVFAATVEQGTVNAVPEPSSLLGGLVGLAGAAGLAWRRRPARPLE